MIKARLNYLIAVIFVIIAGLLSRKIDAIPQWIGDLLWALMVYLMVSALWLKAPVQKKVIISLLFCFGIEFSQMYQADWINRLRQTLPGRLILGQGFLWGDLLAYTLGVCLGVLIERRRQLSL
jgi:uncharacterized membrane protein YfhO